MTDRERVHRRRALQVLGAAVVAPTIAEGARVLHPLVPPQPGGGEWRPRFFTADEGAAVEALAEAIIPETDTPGARAAAVHQYIDWMVSRAGQGDGPAALPEIMRAGLAWLDRRSAPSTAGGSPTLANCGRRSCWRVSPRTRRRRRRPGSSSFGRFAA